MARRVHRLALEGEAPWNLGPGGRMRLHHQAEEEAVLVREEVAETGSPCLVAAEVVETGSPCLVEEEEGPKIPCQAEVDPV